jgi:hypothetical protein
MMQDSSERLGWQAIRCGDELMAGGEEKREKLREKLLSCQEMWSGGVARLGVRGCQAASKKLLVCQGSPREHWMDTIHLGFLSDDWERPWQHRHFVDDANRDRRVSERRLP